MRNRPVYGWREGDKFYLSLDPKKDGSAKNEYLDEKSMRLAAKQRGMVLQYDAT